ncbi:MAG: NADH-quinone oxidoreductase subunit I [Chloroflexi bacterium]|nr:NADH-quinone oxidoreductase subunit I [Chloroflexota bacterium]
MYGLAMAKGMLVTLKNFAKKPFTVQYPEERVKQHPRFRGEEFVWYEERCTGCASCAKFCPLGIIKIVTSPSETAPLQGDKYRLEVFDIDISRCMFCGLCVEACPYDALFMGSGFEQSSYSRKGRVIDIDQLRQAEKLPSTYFRPQLESASYKPQEGQPLDWVDVGRESWRWHEREKAGMRLQPSDASPEAISIGSPDESRGVVEPANEDIGEAGTVSAEETT